MSEVENRWEKVLDAASEVSHLHAQFVAASDRLADAIGYNREWILGRVWVKTVDERRDYKHVFKWLNSEEVTWKHSVEEAIRKEQKQRKLDALLERLNLTDAELELLGIKKCDH